MKWDCRHCGCTYDDEIEKKPKNQICYACRYVLSKRKNIGDLKKWLK